MNSLIQFISTEKAMISFAGKIAELVPPGTIIFLYGQLGTGKTTFTRGFLRGIGYDNKVKSPTYTLVEAYEIQDKHIFHFDFYRLHDAGELHNIGIEEYFSPHTICIIEWPEKGDALLPEPDLACYISFKGTGRQMILEGKSEKGKEILAKISVTAGQGKPSKHSES